jgi:hypothetical protein
VVLTFSTVGTGSQVPPAQAQTRPAEPTVDCTFVVNRADGPRTVESRHTSVVVLKPSPRGGFTGEARTTLGSDYALASQVSLVPDSEPPYPQLFVYTWLVSTEPEARIVGGLSIDSSKSALERDYAEAQDQLRLALEKIRAVAALDGEAKKEVENQLADALKPVARRIIAAGGDFANPQAEDALAKLTARGQSRTLSQAVAQGLVPSRLVTRVTVSCVHVRR